MKTWQVEATPKALGLVDHWLVSQGAFAIPVYTLIGAQAVAKRLNALEAKVALAEEMCAEISRDIVADGGIPWAWYMRWRDRYDALTSPVEVPA